MAFWKGLVSRGQQRDLKTLGGKELGQWEPCGEGKEVDPLYAPTTCFVSPSCCWPVQLEHIHGHDLSLWWRKMSLSWSGCTRDNWADLQHGGWKCRSTSTLKELFQQFFPLQSSGPASDHEAKPKTWASVTVKLHQFVPNADVYVKRGWNGPFLLLPLLVPVWVQPQTPAWALQKQ